MLLLKVVGMLLKYELNELAITSGSLIMMPFSLMEVLDDLQFLSNRNFGKSIDCDCIFEICFDCILIAISFLSDMHASTVFEVLLFLVLNIVL